MTWVCRGRKTNICYKNFKAKYHAEDEVFPPVLLIADPLCDDVFVWRVGGARHVTGDVGDAQVCGDNLVATKVLSSTTICTVLAAHIVALKYILPSDDIFTLYILSSATIRAPVCKIF